MVRHTIQQRTLLTLMVEEIGVDILNDLNNILLRMESKKTPKVAVLLCVMGEKPYEPVHILLAPVKLASKKYQEIVDAMTELLQLKPLIIAKCFMFHKRNKGSSEIVS